MDYWIITNPDGSQEISFVSPFIIEGADDELVVLGDLV